METARSALHIHQKYKGKIGIDVKVPVNDFHDLSLIYTPGVAEPCRKIVGDPDSVYKYTSKSNLVAIVTNGSAVLGLGNIGATAAIPVMEGKAALFKLFANIDAFPLCINSQDPDEIINIILRLEPMFAGINLEDIAAPHCFYIEERLKKALTIPVFHDDQHGTAVVTAAGLLNALKIVGKSLDEIKVVINGAGAAGIAITTMLITLGVDNIIVCDREGIIHQGRQKGMNVIKERIAQRTNKRNISGSLKDALSGADVFIGVSAPNLLTEDMIQSMNDQAIIFAMANPDPEITPDKAKQAGAKVVATGRSDYPNQINNLLAYPGIFRGALDVLATEINREMLLAAVHALANLIPSSDLHEDYIIPSPLDKSVVPAVAKAVREAARKSEVARKLTS